MITYFDLFANLKIRLKQEKAEELVKRIRKNQPVIPKDIGVYAKNPVIIEDVEIKDGSLQSVIKNETHRIRFYTPHEDVYIVGIYKRLFAILAREGFWGLFTIYINRKAWGKWLTRIFEYFPLPLKDEYWSQPVRELRRVLKLFKIEESILDGISLIFEEDMAYRYPLQDLMGEIDKTNDSGVEVRRLLDILIARDNQRNKFLWLKVKKYIWITWLWRKQIKKFIQEINIQEMMLSEDDRYWVKDRTSYRFRGKEVDYGDVA